MGTKLIFHIKVLRRYLRKKCWEYLDLRKRWKRVHDELHKFYSSPNISHELEIRGICSMHQVIKT